VLTDLSKYAGGLEVLQSIKDSTCSVSLEVSSHPTLEAGEKHDTTKLLYDAVFSDSVLGLRCAVSRGSQLDLGKTLRILFSKYSNKLLFGVK
jgi:hypothetical protein